MRLLQIILKMAGLGDWTLGTAAIKLIKFAISCVTILLKVMGANLPVVFSLGALFLIFGLADQGQDILINVNSNQVTPFTLYFMLGVMAMLHWQFPKYMSKKAIELKNFRDIFTADFSSTEDLKDPNRIVPRLFGVATFLIPAYCVLKVMLKYDIRQEWAYDWHSWIPFLYLVVTLLIFGIFFYKKCFLKFYHGLLWKNKESNLFAIICALLAFSPLLFWFFNFGLPSDQIFLFAGWNLYAVLFGLVSSTRWSIKRHLKPESLRRFFKDKAINILVWNLAFLCSAIFLFFVVTNFFNVIFKHTQLLTIGITLCGIVFYLTVSTLLLYWSRRTKKNYFAVVVILMFVLIIVNPGYFHRVETHKVLPTANKVASLRSYASGWIKAREAHLVKDSIYPIIFVNSYGGGIRAAAWTCLVVNRLDSLTDGAFQKHVFSYSGASGGTTGASILCANGFNKYYNASSYAERDALYHRFYTDYDYLTVDLVGLLGNDLIYNIIPANDFKDRAALQAICWEDAYKVCFKEDLYSQDFFDLWNRTSAEKYQVPLLFSNATEVTLGAKGIIAPVRLNAADFTGDVLIRDHLPEGRSLKISTAAFLSARFPYVSPAGQLGDKYFIDGGAKENSGAETNYAVYNLLKEVLRDSFPGMEARFPLICISIKNSNNDDIKEQKAKKMSQLLAPVNGIVNGGINGATEKADSINRLEFGSNYFLLFPQAKNIRWSGTNIFGMKDSENTRPVLPLGWQLSDLAMTYLSQSIKDNATGSTGENSLALIANRLNQYKKRNDQLK